VKTTGICGNFIISPNPQQIFLRQMINVSSTRYLANLLLALASGMVAASHTSPAISSALLFCYVSDTDADNESTLAHTEVKTYS